ncbi:MAG: hypothetical protein RIS92_351 [Verrucomicrobiota bacterium]
MGADWAGLFGSAFAPVKEGGGGQNSGQHEARFERFERVRFVWGERASPRFCGKLEDCGLLSGECSPFLVFEVGCGFHDGFAHGFERGGFTVLRCELPKLFKGCDLFERCVADE